MSGISGGITSLLGSGEAKAAAAKQAWMSLQGMKMMEAMYNADVSRMQPFLDLQLGVGEFSFEKMKEDYERYQKDYGRYEDEYDRYLDDYSRYEKSYDQYQEDRKKYEDIYGEEYGRYKEDYARYGEEYDRYKDDVAKRNAFIQDYADTATAGPGKFENSAWYKDVMRDVGIVGKELNDQLVSQGLNSGPTGTIGEDIQTKMAEYTARAVGEGRMNWLDAWAKTELDPKSRLINAMNPSMKISRGSMPVYSNTARPGMTRPGMPIPGQQSGYSFLNPTPASGSQYASLFQGGFGDIGNAMASGDLGSASIWQGFAADQAQTGADALKFFMM